MIQIRALSSVVFARTSVKMMRRPSGDHFGLIAAWRESTFVS
jgi:hypothetical protein